MKKIIFWLVIAVVVAVAGAAYYILTNLDAIVEAAIEKYGSQATQTAVRVDNVRIKLKEGSAAINGLTVANPKGFDLSQAFSLGMIKTGIDLASIKEEPYVITEITVVAPQVFFEVNNENKTNLNELKKNLGLGKPSARQEKKADQATDAGPRLIIKRILFTDGNIKARVAPLNNKEYDLKLPTIKMQNLGGKKGATATELASEIIDRLIEQAKVTVKEKGIDAELDKLKAKADARVAEEKAKLDARAAEEKAKLKEKTDSKLEEEKQKAEDKLKGLLGQ